MSRLNLNSDKLELDLICFVWEASLSIEKHPLEAAFDPVYPGPQMPSRPAGGLNKLSLLVATNLSLVNPRRISTKPDSEYELPVAPLVSCSESPFKFVLLRESESPLALAAAEHLHWQH